MQCGQCFAWLHCVFAGVSPSAAAREDFQFFLYGLYLAPVLVFCFYLYCVMLRFPVHVHAARAIFAVSEY